MLCVDIRGSLSAHYDDRLLNGICRDPRDRLGLIGKMEIEDENDLEFHSFKVGFGGLRVGASLYGGSSDEEEERDGIKEVVLTNASKMVSWHEV
jgi:hypothetical protein